MGKHLKAAWRLGLLLLFISYGIQAQNKRKISGSVKDSKTNEAIIGATVLVGSSGGATDVDGNFTLEVDAAATEAIISYIGYTTQKVAISDKMSILLVPDAILLKETIVTAVGISREKKSLGYAAQEVKGDVLKESREMNVVNSMAGRVAGVNITSSSGAVGASSSIQLRGATSFTGNNSPLFVINGIPVDNTPGSPRTGSPNTGNPISDINPDDIESINVLKGPVAAALYGSRAQNGAIVITTKTGKGAKGSGSDFQVTYSINSSTDRLLTLPSFQNKYGQGYWGSDPSNPTPDDNYLDADESWGAQLDGRDYVDYRGQNKKWNPQPDNIKNFFQNGSQIDNSLSISSGNEKGSMRFSFSGFNQKGTVPNTAFDKYTTGLNFTRNLTDKLSTEASVSYTLSKGKNRPGTGYDTYNPLQSLFGWFGRQVDMQDLKDNYNEIDPNTGLHTNWQPTWHNNPYWTLYNNTNIDRRDRIISSMKFNYKINDWITASVRAGSDFYVENRFQKFKPGTIDYAIMQNGGFYDDNGKQATSNVDAMIVANKNINENISITGTLGYNFYHKSWSNSTTEVRGLIIPDLYNVASAENAPIITNNKFQKEIIGVYGLASIGYKGMLYLDITGRNDWSSTLPAGKNAYFYPSFSSSFIFTELASLKNISWLSFGKVRAGLAITGNDTDPYNLASYFAKSEIGSDPSIISNPFNGMTYYSLENTLRNNTLKPEKGQSFEIGTDLRFFNSRVGLDVTYYNTTTSDIIVPISVPSSSGFTNLFTNAGKINNQGIEIMLNTTIVKSEDDGFNWNFNLNFGKNNGVIKEVANGLDKILLYRDWAYLYLEKGQSYGTLYGQTMMRNENGDYLVKSNGRLIRDGELANMGSVQPKFRMGFENVFTFKRVTLSALVDWKQGGKVFSQTNLWMDYSGLSDRTAERSENEVHQGVVANNVDGVYQATTTQNTTTINSMQYWHDRAMDFTNYVYDATFVKLRQVTLSYNFPAGIAKKMHCSALSMGVYGRNLWIIYKKLPYMDPEVNAASNSNASGFESNSIPSVRSLGANLKITF